MNVRQQFKLAILAALAEDGCTLDEIHSRVKVAADRLEKRALGIGTTAALYKGLGMGSDAVQDVMGMGGTVGLAGLLGGPPLLGAGLGYLGAKMTDTGGMDVPEAKTLEMIDRYKHLTRQAKMNAELKRRKMSERPSFSRI